MLFNTEFVLAILDEFLRNRDLARSFSPAQIIKEITLKDISIVSIFRQHFQPPVSFNFQNELPRISDQARLFSRTGINSIGDTFREIR